MTDSLLREVDEDMRQERMRQMWRRYRTPLLFIVMTLIVITAGASLWRDHQSKKAGAAMARLDAAISQLDRGLADQALTGFKTLAAESDGELRDISLLWQARAEAQSNKAEDAVKTLTTLAERPSGRDLVWRDLACLRLLSANATTPHACSSTSASPLKSQRMEWHAALFWQNGKYDEARTLLKTIIDDENTPSTQRERAKRLMRTLPAKAA